MDFLNNIQKKYTPSIHKFRYDERKARVNSLKETCLKNPEKLSTEEVKIINRVLKHYKLLPITEESKQLEKMFMAKAGEYFIYSGLVSASPFLVREFYGKGLFKKVGVIGSIFLCSYGLMMRGPLKEVNNYNRKMAQENIHKFSLDLEEAEEDEQKASNVGDDRKK